MNNFNERLETYSNFIKKRRGNENLKVIIWSYVKKKIKLK